MKEEEEEEEEKNKSLRRRRGWSGKKSLQNRVRRITHRAGHSEMTRELHAFRRERAVHTAHLDLLQRLQRVLRGGEPAQRRQIAERQLDELRARAFAEREDFQDGETEKLHGFAGGEAVLSALESPQLRQIRELQRDAGVEVFPLEFDVRKTREI